MKKILFLLMLLFPIKVFADEDLAPNSKSAILVEASTGIVVFEKNSHEKLSIASMTKIMSMILIMENLENGNLSLNDKVLISKNAASMGGSQIFLEEGSNMKVLELLKGVAIASGNDAVVALAEKIAGSEDAFVSMMNKKAKDLGLKDTNFKNPHGLDEANHYSSAYDMSIMALELLKHPDILKYTSIYEEYLVKEDGSRTWLVNSNKLVRFFKGVDGLKSGYTETAGYCLTATGIRNNIRFVSVVMGVSTGELRSSDTSKMLTYGFNSYKINTIVNKDANLGYVNIQNGKKSKIKVKLSDNVNELIKVSDQSNRYKYKVKTSKLVAPVKKGDKIGELVVTTTDNQTVKKITLLSTENIDKASICGLVKKNIKLILSGTI